LTKLEEVLKLNIQIYCRNSMGIKGDLTTKDVMDRFQAMDDRYGILVKDIGYALGKLDEAKTELQKAKDLHEKGIVGGLIKAIDKHPKFSISATVLMLTVLIAAFLFFLKDKKIEVQTENLKLETQEKEGVKK
jgi:hypothetical protein